jgi:hypothetical protein
MNLHQATARWQQKQARAIRNTYRDAWKTGRNAYRSEQHPPNTQHRPAKPPPARPAALPERQALAPALNSLARMGAELVLLVPTAAQIAVAGSMAAAMLLAIKAWIKTNAYRLAGAASVAWAGEQHGYTQAADADGLLLAWQLDGAAHHCDDCLALAGLPAMPLEQWPTMPGDGATECGAGCKCSMTAVAAETPVLSAVQQGALARVAAQQPEPIAA